MLKKLQLKRQELQQHANHLQAMKEGLVLGKALRRIKKKLAQARFHIYVYLNIHHLVNSLAGHFMADWSSFVQSNDIFTICVIYAVVKSCRGSIEEG